MAITLNSYSNFGNKPISVIIDGTTPSELILAENGVVISYENKEIHEPITDWKGTLTLIGTPETFKQFGQIKNDSHKVTITYDSKKWVGYLEPSVYDVANTGFNELFELNVVSSLNNIYEKQFSEITNLYSIQQLLDIIKSFTLLDRVIVKKPFTESLGDIKINSNNFINDDSDAETYRTILEWICTSFGFKAIINDKNELVITSYELLYDSSNIWDDSKHAGINETYSVSKSYDSGRVIASNYQMPPIAAEFNIDGNDSLVWGITGLYEKTHWVTGSYMDDPYPNVANKDKRHPFSLEYNRGKGQSVGKDGNWITYDRSLYQYGEGKQWKFNKYKSAGVLANEHSASLTNNTAAGIDYMNNNGELLPGAYPIAYRAYGSKDKVLPEYEKTTIFKLNYYNTDTILDQNSAKNMIYWKREGIQCPDQQYIFFTIEYANGAYYGKIDGNSNPQWPTSNDGYNNKKPRGFGNMDLCPICLVNDYAYDTRNAGKLCLTAKVKKLDGTELYWSFNKDSNPSWRPDNGSQWTARLENNSKGCYEFSPILNMSKPKRNNIEVPLWKEKYGFWIELPTFYCDMEIMMGVSYTNTTSAPMAVIMRNFVIEQVGAMEVFGEENEAFERKDTIYATDIMTDNCLKDVTFNMCSLNEYNGLSGLYYQSDIEILDKLTYPIGQEKIEEHYLRLMTKSFSKYTTYSDEIFLDDLKFNYSDRWFNGGELNLTNGTIEGQFISHNINLTGNI